MAKIFADLRVFGAIGFQDAPGAGGAWLAKQGYRPQNNLLKRIVDTCLEKKVSIIGLTSEDDKMAPGSPEDRFGFLMKQRNNLSSQGEYISAPIGANILRVYVRSKGIVTIINSETVHTHSIQDWYGLKVHVVGGNLLPKNLGIKDTINFANDKGYMTFIMGTGKNERAKELVNELSGNYTGILTHDANNTIPDWMTHIPIIGKSLTSKSREINNSALEEAVKKGQINIPVSSAHWMHEIGNAGFNFEQQNENKPIEEIREAIVSNKIEPKCGYNDAIDVIKTGFWLNHYGKNENRFKGTASSYNS